jgi:hypothetical protein
MGLQHKALSAWGTITIAIANQLDNVASLTKREKTEHIVLALIKLADNKLEHFVMTQSALLFSEVNHVKMQFAIWSPSSKAVWQQRQQGSMM